VSGGAVVAGDGAVVAGFGAVVAGFGAVVAGAQPCRGPGSAVIIVSPVKERTSIRP
jgi:hypothetical protein